MKIYVKRIRNIHENLLKGFERRLMFEIKISQSNIRWENLRWKLNENKFEFKSSESFEKHESSLLIFYLLWCRHQPIPSQRTLRVDPSPDIWLRCREPANNFYSIKFVSNISKINKPGNVIAKFSGERQRCKRRLSCQLISEVDVVERTLSWKRLDRDKQKLRVISNKN